MGNGIYDMLLFRAPFLDNRNGFPMANPTPEWSDLYQTSQAPAFSVFGWLLNATETGLYDVNEEGAWTFRMVAEQAGETAAVEICIHTANADCDSDDDDDDDDDEDEDEDEDDDDDEDDDEDDDDDDDE